MCQDVTIAYPGTPLAEGLHTLRNSENGLFRLFRAFSAFPTDSGGPSLHLEPEVTEGAEVTRMVTFAVLVTSGTRGTPGSRPLKGVWNPYSWPPELANPSSAGIPGLHTAHFPEKGGSGLFVFS